MPHQSEVFEVWQSDAEALGLDQSMRNAVAFLMGGCNGLANNEEEVRGFNSFCEIDSDLESAYGAITSELTDILAKAALTLNPAIKFRNVYKPENPIYAWNTGDQSDYLNIAPQFNLKAFEGFYDDLLHRIAFELDKTGYEETQCYGAGLLVLSSQFSVDMDGTAQVYNTLKALPPPYLGYLMNLPSSFERTKAVTPDFYEAPVFSKLLLTLMGSGDNHDPLFVGIWNMHNAHFYNPEKGSVQYRNEWLETPLEDWLVKILLFIIHTTVDNNRKILNDLESSNEYQNYPYFGKSIDFDEFQNAVWDKLYEKYGYTGEIPATKYNHYEFLAAYYFEASKLRYVVNIPEVDEALESGYKGWRFILKEDGWVADLEQ
jgi:hypothetical protein